MGKKRTPQEAKEEIEREGYKLLSEYKGANELVTIQCPKGHIYDIQFNGFHKGRRCKLCINKNVKYGWWFCGHLHIDEIVKKTQILYEKIVKIK